MTRYLRMSNGSGRPISVKLDTNIHRERGHCCKAFQGQRSKVEVIFNNHLRIVVVRIRTC